MKQVGLSSEAGRLASYDGAGLVKQVFLLESSEESSEAGMLVKLESSEAGRLVVSYDGAECIEAGRLYVKQVFCKL